MKRKTFFKLRGLVSLIAAAIILVGSLFIPTVKLTANNINGLRDDGTYLSAINRLAAIAGEKGATEDEIDAKYGKYGQTATDEYLAIGKTTKDLLNEIEPKYNEWKTSGTDFDSLEPSVRASFYYYRVYMYQNELDYIGTLTSLGDKDIVIKDFLSTREPLKQDLKDLLDSKATFDAYKTALENAITVSRTELTKLLDNTDDTYDNGVDYSYSFNSPSVFQVLINLSNIDNILELVSKESELIEKKASFADNNDKLNALENLKEYCEEKIPEKIDELKTLMTELGYDIDGDIANVQDLIDAKQSEIYAATTAKIEKEGWLANQITDEFLNSLGTSNQEEKDAWDANHEITDKLIKLLNSYLNKQVSAANTKIKNAKAAINNKNANILTLQEEIAAKQTEIAEIGAKIDAYNQSIEDLKSLMTSLGYDINTDTYTYHNNQTEITKTIIEIINEEIEEKQVYLDNATTKKATEEGKLAAKQAELETAMASVQIDEELALIESKETEIANIKTLQADIKDAQDIIKKKTAEIESLTEWIEKASDINNTEDRSNYYWFVFDRAEQLLEQKAQELEEINQPVTALEETVADITAVASAYKKAVEGLKSFKGDAIDPSTNKVITAMINEEKRAKNETLNAQKAEIRDAVAEKEGEIDEITGAKDLVNEFMNGLDNSLNSIERTTNTISELSQEIEDLENYVAENYEKYADSLNDVSFAYAMYYTRGISSLQMKFDKTIADNAELYYELYNGIVHTTGVDIKTLSYLSFILLVLAVICCVFFIAEIIVKTIKLIHNKQQLYAFGINAFSKAMILFTGWTVFTVMFNSLSFGTGKLSVFGWILSIICVTVLALNFVGGRSQRISFTGKKALNLIQIFSAIEIVLLSVALGIFMFGGVANQLTTVTADFVAFRKRSLGSCPVSFIWAIPAACFIIVIGLNILKNAKTLGMLQQKFGTKGNPNRHISEGFNYTLLIIGLSCIAVMFALLIIFAQLFSALIVKLIITFVLISLALAARIVQNKLLKKRFPRFTVNDISEILSESCAAPNETQGEENLSIYL